MQVIGIRCGPIRTMRSLAAHRRRGRKGAEQSRERLLTLSGQSPARRPSFWRRFAGLSSHALKPRALSLREHPSAGASGRGSPSLITLKYCDLPLSGRGPPHCTLMSGCTCRHFLPSAWTLIYKRKPAALLVCEWLKRAQAVSDSLSFINAAMHCAGSRCCPMVRLGGVSFGDVARPGVYDQPPGQAAAAATARARPS